MSDEVPLRALRHLSRLNREFYGQTVDVLDAPPNANDVSSMMDFASRFVQQNRPCVIRHAVDHWPALHLWQSNDYLREKVDAHGEPLTVTLTPNGRADAVVTVEEQRARGWKVVLERQGTENDVVKEWEGETEPFFVVPHEQKMSMHHFLSIMEKQRHMQEGDPNPASVNESDQWSFYVQQQNDNFRKDHAFRSLLQDAEQEFDWANLLFQARPDACNIWFGNSRSVTSTHKDNYENIYVVVSGKKHFTLFPPSDYHYMYMRKYRYGRYYMVEEEEEEDKGWQIRVAEPAIHVPWVSVDSGAPDFTQWTRYAHARPIRVTVNAGETLYLPSLWFHHVEQEGDESGKNISVNMWYDMQFGPAYNYSKTVEKMSNLLDGFDLQDEDEEDDELNDKTID